MNENERIGMAVETLRSLKMVGAVKRDPKNSNNILVATKTGFVSMNVMDVVMNLAHENVMVPEFVSA